MFVFTHHGNSYVAMYVLHVFIKEIPQLAIAITESLCLHIAIANETEICMTN